MEDAVVHYVDGVGGYGPVYLLVIGVLALATVILIKYMPFWKECRLRRLDIDSERESRKVEEARLRAERERESTAVAHMQIEAQERSTAAMNAMTQQMAVFDSRLEISQRGSAAMQMQLKDAVGEIHDMAGEVHDIHTAIVIRPSSKD